MILRNCRLIKELCADGVPDRADIYVSEGKIAGIEPCGANFGDDAEEYDCQDRFAVPGFIDLHVHLDAPCHHDVLADNCISVAERTLRTLKSAQKTLRAGFTTLRDVGARSGVDFAVRDAISKGEFEGPRLIVSGQIITPIERGNYFFEKLYDEADGPIEMRKAARRQLANGADFVKYMGTGAVTNPGGAPGSAICSEDEIRELVAVAADHGTYVAGHNHGSEGIKRAIRSGVRTIEHSSLIDDECIKLYKNHESFPVPNLMTPVMLRKHNLGGATENTNRIYELRMTSYRRLYDEGLKIGFGTDVGVAHCHHGENGNEFIFRHEITGMKPIDILLQATRNSAEIAKIDHVTGSIAVGKGADIVVLQGDPREDISLCVRGIEKVMSKGKFFNGRGLS